MSIASIRSYVRDFFNPTVAVVERSAMIFTSGAFMPHYAPHRIFLRKWDIVHGAQFSFRLKGTLFVVVSGPIYYLAFSRKTGKYSRIA